MMNLSKVTEQELETLLSQLTTRIEKQARELAVARSKYENLENFTKIIFHTAMPKTGKELDQKKHAYGSVDYIVHIEGLNDAYSEFRSAEAEYKITELKWDTVKTILMKRLVKIV